MIPPDYPAKLRAYPSVAPGSYGRVVAVVRQQVKRAPSEFTIRDIFECLRCEPGVVFSSVSQAFIRLRKTGEIVVSRKGRGCKPTLFAPGQK